MDIDNNTADEISTFEETITIESISELFEICVGQCSLKYLSVLIFMSLRHFGVTQNALIDFQRDIGALSVKTTHKWAKTFISGDFEDFQGGIRGGKYMNIQVKNKINF